MEQVNGMISEMKQEIIQLQSENKQLREQNENLKHRFEVKVSGVGVVFGSGKFSSLT